MTERKVWAKSTAPNSAAFRVKVYEGDLVDDLKKAIAIEKRFNYGADLLIVKEEPDTPVLIEVDMKLIFSTTGIGATKENPYYFSEPTGGGSLCSDSPAASFSKSMFGVDYEIKRVNSGNVACFKYRCPIVSTTNDDQSKLFIRMDYERLTKQVLKDNNSGKLRVILTGKGGIGKSKLLIYLAMEICKLNVNSKIMYSDSRSAIIFTRNGVVEALGPDSATNLMQQLSGEDFWLMDGAEHGPWTQFPGHIILAASRREENFPKFKDSAVEYWLPDWDYTEDPDESDSYVAPTETVPGISGELVSFKNEFFQDFPMDIFEYAVAIWGPAPRYCLQKPSSRRKSASNDAEMVGESEVAAAINDVKPLELIRCIGAKCWGTRKGLKLCTYSVNRESYMSISGVMLSTQHINDTFFNEYEHDLNTAQRGKMVASFNDSEMGPFWGRLFEAMGHRVVGNMTTGSHLISHMMHSGGETVSSDIAFNQTIQTKYFSSASEVDREEGGVYWIPRSKIFASIDAILVMNDKCYLFQYYKATQHGYNMTGVENVLSALGFEDEGNIIMSESVELCLVLPDLANYTSASLQKFLTSKNTVAKVTRGLENLKQRKIEIPVTTVDVSKKRKITEGN